MSVYQDHKPSSGGGDYLKLKDGDKIKLRIASEPVISVYKKGDRPRYSWVVWNRNDKKAQVYTAGISVYGQIADLTEEWGDDPTDFDITIKRTGSGMQDTSYSVTPVKESADLTKDEQAEVDKVDLLMATKGKWLADYVDDQILPEPISNEPRDDSPPPSDEDAPSGYDKAKATASKIKGGELPDDMPENFLN